MVGSAICENCMHYYYDDEYEYYACDMDLDEDEMRLFVLNQCSSCPYFQLGDEYTIIRKQM